MKYKPTIAETDAAFETVFKIRVVEMEPESDPEAVPLPLPVIEETTQPRETIEKQNERFVYYSDAMIAREQKLARELQFATGTLTWFNALKAARALIKAEQEATS